ncbi:aspartic peptidase domain-containing protein [Morchella snyderi]|nr:aspartic peptidase domain-containing protein [Morchella snyderi]
MFLTKYCFSAVSISLTLLSLLPSLITAENCSSLPLALPITNVTLSTSHIRRGIAASLGTPPQDFSMRFSASLNSTVFTTSTNCVDSSTSTENRCIVVKGGVYDRDNSNTWSGPMTKQEFLKVAAADTLKTVDTLGEETLKIGGVTVTSLPIGVEDGTDIGTSSLGLAINSSLVDVMVDAGDIPSRMWGVDYGWVGATSDTWADGEMVLGGYDKARVKNDKLYSQAFPENLADSDGCALIVYITGITMKNSTDSLDLMESKGDSLRACVSPEYDLMTMPYDLFKVFNDAMGDVYENRTTGDFYLWGFESDNAKGYDGDMEIKFSTGLTVTIPNHQLILPYRDYDKNGKAYIKNAKQNVLMINSLQQVNENDLPLLGLPFLSSAYLVVDPDQGRFLLGESQRSTTPNLVAGSLDLCPANADTTPTGIVDSPTSTSSTSPTATNSSSPSSSSSAAVIGGSIGGVAAVAIIGILAFVFWRRSKKQKMTEEENSGATTGETMHMVSVPPELDGSSTSGSMHVAGAGGLVENYKPPAVSYELPETIHEPVYEADSNPVYYTEQPQQQKHAR